MYRKIMAKHPFYQIFSWWGFTLITLYLLKIIKFSLFPIVLFTFFGALGFLLILYIKKRPFFNYNLALLILITHSIGFLLVPLSATPTDIIYNLLIFIVYLLSLSLQNTNVYDVYYNIYLSYNKKQTIYSYYKDEGIFD